MNTKLCCGNCKKLFKVKKGKYYQKFCSLACYYNFPKSKKTREKISKYVKKNPIKNRPRGKSLYNWNKIKKKCIICNKRFFVSPAFKNQEHCSRNCYFGATNKINKRGEKSSSWLGGFCEYRGSEWIRIRNKVYQRDNYTCKLCGKSRKEGVRLIAHHNIPRRFKEKIKEDFGMDINIDNLNNLITLCTPCHSKIENTFYRKSIKEKKIPLIIIEEVTRLK